MRLWLRGDTQYDVNGSFRNDYLIFVHNSSTDVHGEGKGSMLLRFLREDIGRPFILAQPGVAAAVPLTVHAEREMLEQGEFIFKVLYSLSQE